ncbi:MAG: hypothetical protein GVY34_09205 [Alphaproteobacteria bacterium]|jgi:hypothetical protein|nr:hypothetical protein [Alphaproteobacteria bacterium]
MCRTKKPSTAPDTIAKGSGFAALVPDARLVEIAPAAHFSVRPRCSRHGAAILAEENDDPVCTDPDGADRATIHARVLATLRGHPGLD